MLVLPGDRSYGLVTYVAHRDTMFEFATSAGVRWRSFLIVWVNYRGCQHTEVSP